MKAIGGYFELADFDCVDGRFPIEGVRLNTCRNALEYIILQLVDAKHIYLPFYTCEAVVEPLKRLPISYSFYYINSRFEIAEDIHLNDGDYLIANNYFGLKDAYIAELALKYGDHLIVDNAQAFFAPILPNVRAAYSCRKYVGVADGGIAVGVPIQPSLQYNQDNSSEHNSHLLIRKVQGAEAGFKDYQANECKLDNQSIRRMSSETENSLIHVDYEKMIVKRRENFQYLHSVLGSKNKLTLPDMDSFVCPMVYPYLTDDDTFRAKLFESKIFVARYWPNVLDWVNLEILEYKLTTNLIPLPVDQRYGKEDMEIIFNIIQSNND